MGPTIQAGRVLARSFSVLSARFGPLFGSVLLLYLPFLVGYALLSTVPEAETVGMVAVALGLLSFALLTPLASAAVIRGVFLHLRGEEVGFGDCWRGLGAIWLRVILLAVGVGVLTTVGFFLCAVPGFILQTALFVAIPALVVERTGVGDAFNRSWSLTEGHRLPIFFLVLALGVLSFALSYSAGFLMGYLGASATVIDVVTQVLQALLTALQAVIAGVVYFDLREIREGLGLDDLAAVFD
ncbi:MAG: hypothetical protein PVG07_09000 [Acidobacteriota bacterium]|jgi:hypothetical protein